MHTASELLRSAVFGAEPKSLHDMCVAWGVRPPYTGPTQEERDAAQSRLTSLSEFCTFGESFDAGSFRLCAEAVHHANLRELREGAPSALLRNLSECETQGEKEAESVNYLRNIVPECVLDDPTTEVGRDGVYIAGGILYVDPSPRMQPYRARGFLGPQSQYNEAVREPMHYKVLQGVREFLFDGEWDIEVSKDTPEEIRPLVEAHAQQWWDALRTMPGGWEGYLNNAATAVIFGFTPFEVVWKRRPVEVDDTPLGTAWVPRKIAFRRQDTVQQWLMSPREDELIAVRFQTGGEFATGYTLPAWGARITDHRVALVRIGAEGNNWEGIPFSRTVDTFRAQKELLVTIQAACAERFGAPILMAKLDPAWLSVIKEGGKYPSEAEWSEFFDFLATLLAMDTPTGGAPAGLTAEYVGPGGTMPQFQDQIAYADQQIMTAASNQGALLGQHGHGSYALAEVQDNDLVRSAPYYARMMVAPINEMIRKSFELQFGLELPEPPRIVYKISAAENATAIIDDMIKVHTVVNPTAPFPPAMRERALLLLGLPSDTYDEMEAQEEGAALDIEDPTRDLAPLAVDAVQNAECDHDHFKQPLTLAESELDSEIRGVKGRMDRAQSALVKRFEQMSRDMRAEWKELIRDNTSPLDINADVDLLSSRWKPRWRDAVIEEMTAVAQLAADDMAKQLGTDVQPITLDNAALLQAQSVADEGVNRTIGVMLDRETEREGGRRGLSVPVLAASTLAIIAARALTRAVNHGRDVLVQAFASSLTPPGEKPATMKATRDATLDANTCEKCIELNGRTMIVGSKEYYNLMPPQHCLGGSRCRCVYRYSRA